MFEEGFTFRTVPKWFRLACRLLETKLLFNDKVLSAVAIRVTAGIGLKWAVVAGTLPNM